MHASTLLYSIFMTVLATKASCVHVCFTGGFPCGTACCIGDLVPSERQVCANAEISLCCSVGQVDADGICCDPGQDNVGGVCTV
jgi:hypothetical protein